MNVNAIVNSGKLNFEGKSKKSELKNKEYPQADTPLSKDAAKAMRNLITGLMLLGAATGCSMGSRDKEVSTPVPQDFQEDATSLLPENLTDSILAQASNIGIKVNDDKFTSAITHNRFDDIKYETKVGDNFDLVSKVIDDGKLLGYIGANISDIPNKGIRIDKSFRKVGSDDWNYIGYEIRSNGARKNSPGVNFVEKYDNDGTLILDGKEIKGAEPGKYTFSMDLPDGDTLNYAFESQINVK